MSFTRVSGDRFVRETTRAFDFPYCSRCVEHSRRWSAAWRLTALIIVAGAAACAIAGLARGALAGAGVAVTAAALAVVVGLVRRERARAACCPSCVGPGAAVTYHGWNGDVQTFWFASTRYATEFAEQNERRLVDVTAHLHRLLEECGAKVPPPALPSRLPKATLPLPAPSPASQSAALDPASQPAALGPAIPWPQRVERPRVRDYLTRIEESAGVLGGMAAKPSGETS
ncbi:MAG TPA: hypothetical protein VN253_02495 [Kofleriaceae bacterium]|nr:hypothetical protein [Kofleriaceae bacterium]